MLRRVFSDMCYGRYQLAASWLADLNDARCRVERALSVGILVTGKLAEAD